ncbi:MAG: putative DNA binding domain-containing protein [Acidaminococcaceae bacterium]|nr:putative DNA binding domain-containing protein [Acidaminococcaceae bacterium]
MDKPTKETLTIEFKSDKKCLPMDDLYKEVVAMANTDGGIICLGMENDGSVSGLHNQHSDITKMAAEIQTHTVPAQYTVMHIENWEGCDVLVIEIKMSRQLVMTSDGRYMRRRMKQDGTPEMIPMQPYEIMQRLSSIQAVDPSAQVIESIPAKKALNPVERERLRGIIRTYHGEMSLLELSDEELDKTLELVRERDNELYPTIAGLLLLGFEQYIREYVPGNEVLFQVLDGVNVLSNPPAMKGALLEIFEKVNLLFQSRVTEQEIQVGLFRVPIPNYENDAFREGFVNALVHRDYFRAGAVQVQLQNKSMVISSPGGFPEGVTPSNILTVAPTPRNRILAEAVKRIGLAERTGRGVDKIYRAMLRSGHDMPDYSDSNSTSVILRLNSAELDEQFVRMLINEEKRMGALMPVDALIVLSSLKTERRATIAVLAQKIQKREADARNTVEWLVELGVIEGVGNGNARRYMLSSKLYAITGNETGYTRQRGMTTLQEMGLIERHIDKFGKISRMEAAELCKCDRNHAYYILRKMTEEGRAAVIKLGKSSYYVRKNSNLT